MNEYNDHYFNNLEKQYYDFYYRKRLALSQKLTPQIKVSGYINQKISLLNDLGYVTLNLKTPSIANNIKKIQNQVFELYREKIRVIENPLRIDGVYDLIKEGLVPFATGYYGCVPTISYVKIVKSYKSNDAKDTQFFHRDPGSYKLLKAIIYLNDVDSFGGPLVYVNGSNKDNLLGMSGRARLDDSLIQEQHANNIHEIVGPSGQITFFDARGIHKGKLPTKNSRTAIIVNFSLHTEYGQKDNYSKISYDFKADYSDYDLMLLDSCIPTFGAKNDSQS